MRVGVEGGQLMVEEGVVLVALAGLVEVVAFVLIVGLGRVGGSRSQD